MSTAEERVRGAVTGRNEYAPTSGSEQARRSFMWKGRGGRPNDATREVWSKFQYLGRSRREADRVDSTMGRPLKIRQGGEQRHSRHLATHDNVRLRHVVALLLECVVILVSTTHGGGRPVR